jgi:hypothetical protein
MLLGAWADHHIRGHYCFVGLFVLDAFVPHRRVCTFLSYAFCPQDREGTSEYCFLRGLVSAAELNGKLCKIRRHRTSSEGRMVVELHDGSVLSVKFDNLERFAWKPVRFVVGLMFSASVY